MNEANTFEPGMHVDQPAAAEPALTTRTHLWFVILIVGYMIDCADRFMVSAVLPAIKAEFAFSDARIGMIGGSFYLGLALLAVPMGLLVDRTSRKYMISGMLFVWSIATLAMGGARGFGSMLLSRIGVGMGESGYNPAAYALMSAWYPKRVRATVVGIFTMAAPLGGGIGIALAGYLTHRYGWRHVFGVMAVPGLVLALIFLFAPDYRARRAPSSGGGGVHAPVGETLRFIVGNRALLLVLLTELVLFIYVGGFNVWGVVFLMRAFSLDVVHASRFATLVVLFGAIGAIFGGVMSDWFKRRSDLGRIHSMLTSLPLFATFGMLFLLTPRLGLGLGFGVSMACAAQFCQASIWASIVAGAIDLVPPHYRATTMSCEPLFMGLSAFVAPPLIGWISDHSNLTLALQSALLTSVVGCVLLLLAARRSYREDAEKQGLIGSITVDLI
jgi:MFS family permease